MVASIRRMRARIVPRSHEHIGEIGAPVNVFSISCSFGVQNRGTAPGRVAVRLDLERQETGPNATWFRYTPLADDSEEVEPGLYKPGIITDKLFRDTGVHAIGAGVSPIIDAGETIEKSQIGLAPTAVIQIIVGGDPAVEDWVRQYFWGSTFTINAWLYHINEDHTTIREIAYHEFSDAFSFGGYYSIASDIIEVAYPSLTIISA